MATSQKLFHGDLERAPEVEGLINRLDGTSEDARAAEALIAASRLMEYAAFEVAPMETPRPVGQLIQLAAELSRIASDMNTLTTKQRDSLRVATHLS